MTRCPNSLLCAVALLFAASVACVAAEDVHDQLLGVAADHPLEAFTEFVRHHNKAYLKDGAEFQRRFEVFQANLAKIAAHNARNDASYTLGLNAHADLTSEEFKLQYFGENPTDLLQLRAAVAAAEPNPGPEPIAGKHRRKHEAKEAAKINPGPFTYGDETPAESVNWAAKGMITAVKDQHQNGSPCGCCYAFGGMAGIEAANALYTGKPVALAEQEIVSCDTLDFGCNGGDFTNVYKWAMVNGGVDTMADWPYVANVTKCPKKKMHHNREVTIDGFVNIPPSNETALMQALTHTPTSTGVCCGQFLDQWHLYKSGIFDESVHCAEPIDHSVLIAGYGTDETTGTPYWLVKNSWGDHWGEAGYIRFKRNVEDPRGQSGLATMPAFAYKNSSSPEHAGAAITSHRSWVSSKDSAAGAKANGVVSRLVSRFVDSARISQWGTQEA